MGCGYHVKWHFWQGILVLAIACKTIKNRKEASELICPWCNWAYLVQSWTNLILANKHTPETSYLLFWQPGQCTFIWLCIWDGPDVRLNKKEKAPGGHRSKPPASGVLKWDDTSNILHTGLCMLDRCQAPWRGLWNTDQFRWRSQQLLKPGALSWNWAVKYLRVKSSLK